ncbi:alkylhydroperoxidase [Streptomyces sp. NPDC050388]|uniref:carboxymuconolactone decarboxylase family protein n=1 Tax=Streptomyces sp. NPDC050388 TaxID=3155781 RepID=UPI0034175D05
MPHVETANGPSGINRPLAQWPDTGAVLTQLAETLLRCGEPPIGRGERELIATYVSELNHMRFCSDSHNAFAAAQLEGGADLVRAVLADAAAPVPSLLKALLRIAAQVQAQAQAQPVSHEAIAAAPAEGATDRHNHDTVLIAAAFCMLNRYVNALATELPSDPPYYRTAADRIVNRGYQTAR